jgi:hypothetical protein
MEGIDGKGIEGISEVACVAAGALTYVGDLQGKREIPKARNVRTHQSNSARCRFN